MKKIIVMDFEDYAAMHGVYQFAGDVATHKLPGASAGQKKRIAQTQLKRIQKNWELGQQLRTEYDALVVAGKMRPKTHLEKIELAAQGDPDKEQTKAAKRLLAKYKKLPLDKSK